MSRATTPATMRAAWYERKGPAREVLQVGMLPVPEPATGEVRVRVAVSGLNPIDTKSRSAWRGQTSLPFPRIIPHEDGAGVIDAVGPGVSQARLGERVWLYEAQWGRTSGTAAEYVVVPEGNAVPLPAGVSFSDGACLGIAAMTAHRCLFADGPLKAKTVLVTGAVGGVGQYAVQLARWAGATVIATVSSAEKAAQARAIGADHVINYREEDVVSRVHSLTGGVGVDRVIEVAFATNLPLSLQAVKSSGVIATYASDANVMPTLPFGQLLWKDLTLRFVLVYLMGEAAHQAAIADINAALASGPFRPVAVQRFSLDEIAAAHETIEAGHTAGKLLIEINDLEGAEENR